MKRFIIVLILVISSLVGSAQITRNVWGLELGKSTRQQVINVLKQKGYTPDTNNPSNSVTIKADNFKFGGGYWTYASFEFHGGKLYEIWFQNNQFENPVNNQDMFDLLKERLDSKYGQFRHSGLNTDESNLCYYDGKTYMWLNIRYFEGVQYISITYTDEKLWEQKMNDDEDEL